MIGTMAIQKPDQLKSNLQKVWISNGRISDPHYTFNKLDPTFRLEAMYPHHREVTEVADQLARCYCMMGQYKEAAQYLKACLPAIEER